MGGGQPRLEAVSLLLGSLAFGRLDLPTVFQVEFEAPGVQLQLLPELEEVKVFGSKVGHLFVVLGPDRVHRLVFFRQLTDQVLLDAWKKCSIVSVLYKPVLTKKKRSTTRALS